MKKWLMAALFWGMSSIALASLSMPTVQGLALGETLNATKSKLGKPLRQNYTAPNVCNNDSRDLELHYKGMVVTLIESARHQYVVSDVEITANPWKLNGVGIGDSSATIQRTFGQTQIINGVLPYNTRGEPYGFDFIMHNNKVKKISYNSYLC
ncbi:MAG: hypothetical protein KA221_10405 [Vitreoscilla sp.]|nr:hypothetical protein [Vitreoscilla sp.]